MGVRTRAAARHVGGDGNISRAADGFQEASSAGLPVSSVPVAYAGPPAACEGRQGPAEELLDRSRYNCLDSPFLDLHSPFTAWCKPKEAQMLPPEPSTPVICLYSLILCRLLCQKFSTTVETVALSEADALRGDWGRGHREAFKMAVLLPWVPFRIALIIASLTCLAVCSYLAALGWCAR